MTEHVVNVDLGVVWEPNVPDALLTASDAGFTCLWISSRWDDPDQRDVVLVWSRARLVRMEPPNDEALHGHRLYRVGLADVDWIGEVYESTLIDELEAANRVLSGHDSRMWRRLRHWIVPLKECVVEVVADGVVVERRDRLR